MSKEILVTNFHENRMENSLSVTGLWSRGHSGFKVFARDGIWRRDGNFIRFWLRRNFFTSSQKQNLKKETVRHIIIQHDEPNYDPNPGLNNSYIFRLYINQNHYMYVVHSDIKCLMTNLLKIAIRKCHKDQNKHVVSMTIINVNPACVCMHLYFISCIKFSLFVEKDRKLFMYDISYIVSINCLKCGLYTSAFCYISYKASLYLSESVFGVFKFSFIWV